VVKELFDRVMRDVNLLRLLQLRIASFHSFGFRKDTTTCEEGSERVKVCIKVCNSYSAQKFNETVLVAA
jgi:hypothetical protein